MTPHVAPVPPRRALALLVLAAALACTAAHRSARAPAVEVLPDGSQIVCQMERPTGSNIAQEVCRRSDPGSLARIRLQQELIEARSQVTKP